MKLAVTIDGFSDIEQSIKSIQRAMQSGLEDIAMSGAKIIENEAKRLAPVRTGTLRRSISSEIAESDGRHAIAAIGPHVEYGVYVEFGTRRMAAQPYMRPAFETKQEEARQYMRETGREILDEVLTNEINTRAARRRGRH